MVFLKFLGQDRKKFNIIILSNTRLKIALGAFLQHLSRVQCAFVSELCWINMNTLVCTILNIFKPLKKNKVLQQSKYVPKDIIINKKYDLDIKITYSKAWRTKELAVKLNNGSHEESYTMLPTYCEDIKNMNPGSPAFANIMNDNKFRCIFIC